MVRKPFLNNFHVFVLLAALVFFVDVSLTEDKLTADNVFSNKSSVPATSITCDAIPTLPSNETFCVCRLSDSQALIDLRGLAWTLSDPQRKGPRFVTGDDPKYSGWLAGWSPCSSFSLYTDNPLRTWAACWNAGFARFDNNSKYCQEEWSHVTSDFRVDANTRAVYLRFNEGNKVAALEATFFKDETQK